MSAVRTVQQAFAALQRTAPYRARIVTIGTTTRPSALQKFSRTSTLSSLRHQTIRKPFSTKSRLRAGDAGLSESKTKQASVSKSLSQRLRDLSKEYGWTAVGTYFALSALDFPFCFLAVRWIGTEKIAALEHAIVEWVKKASPVQIPANYRFWEKHAESEEGIPLEREVYDHGVKEAEIANKGTGASLGTQLALAYAIHKSFIFVRVPLTAAILPKVVKTLRGWGWKVGNKKPKVDIIPKP